MSETSSWGEDIDETVGHIGGSDDRLTDVIVSVDDTDDVTRLTSTGEIAELVAKEADALGGRRRLSVTRHQLLLRDDVPYTSHNSSMVFETVLSRSLVDRLRRRAIEIIAAKKADSADPGLCIACLPSGLRADLARRSERAETCGTDVPHGGCDEVDMRDAEQLMAFGRHAQIEFCSIDSAYELARTIPWVTLSEHGGTGAGVVGALAGIGLRLSGNDGRFRGKCDLFELEAQHPISTVSEMIECLSVRFSGPVRAVDTRGCDLPADTPVLLRNDAKPLLSQGAFTLVCEIQGGVAYPCSKTNLGQAGNAEPAIGFGTCRGFAWDNDPEECLGDERTCRNCLYRRWVDRGFTCERNA